MLLRLLFTMMMTFSSLKAISISVYPSISQAPSDIKLILIIPRNPDNDAYCLEWDGGDYGLSCTNMLGEREPVTKQVILKSLSSGDYTITATLYQRGEKKSTDIKQFTVN